MSMEQNIAAGGDAYAVQAETIGTLYNGPVYNQQTQQIVIFPTYPQRLTDTSAAENEEDKVVDCKLPMNLTVLQPVKAKLARIWKTLAVAYEIPTHIVEEVEAAHPNATNEELVEHITLKWIERAKLKATIGEFAQALKDIDRPQLVKEIVPYIGRDDYLKLIPTLSLTAPNQPLALCDNAQ